MLTDKPNIVIAHTPKCARHKRKASAVPARTVVDHGALSEMTEEEHRRRGEAADRLLAEMKRRVAGNG